MLLGKYNILLMDEPGNYLDLKSIAALETMMKSYAGTIIFVSHDKQLVDNIADIIYEIKDHKIIKTFERLLMIANLIRTLIIELFKGN
jgi:macrolide transport system ATP-binding/permease protein